MTKTILLLHVASTLFLVGVIWVIQIVQYPFFSQISTNSFAAFHRTYRNWITPIVAPPMILELATAIWLLFFPIENIDGKLVWSGLALIVVIWISTFFIQVPLHEKLAEKFDSKFHAALVRTNWIRTFAWSLRGVLVCGFIWQMMK
jgi:uncharacterized membrane protein YGL010W